MPLLEGDVKAKKKWLAVVEGDTKDNKKSLPIVEGVATISGEHANICKILKEKNMGYSDMMFPCPVKNVGLVSSSLCCIYLLMLAISEFDLWNVSQFHNFSI